MNAKPITWTRLTAGHYRNAETGVEIHQGESGNWFIYSPLPAADAMRCEGSRSTLAHAKLIGKAAVLAMRNRREADYADAMTIAQTTADHSRGRRVRKLVTMHGMTVAEAMEADAETQRLLAEAPEALNHLWTGQVDYAVCFQDITSTPYTFGSPEIAEVTCPVCRFRYDRYAAELRTELAKFAKGEPPYDLSTITLTAPLDNGAGVDFVRWQVAITPDLYEYAVGSLISEYCVTREGAEALLEAESTAALAGGC